MSPRMACTVAPLSRASILARSSARSAIRPRRAEERLTTLGDAQGRPPFPGPLGCGDRALGVIRGAIRDLGQVLKGAGADRRDVSFDEELTSSPSMSMLYESAILGIAAELFTSAPQ